MHIDLTLQRDAERMAQTMLAPRPVRPARSPWRGMLAAIARLGDDRAVLVSHSERPWASVTFSGTRHTVVMTFSGSEGIAAGERFVFAVPDHEFAIPGQLVADAAVVAVDHVLLPEPAMTVTCQLVLLDDQ